MGEEPRRPWEQQAGETTRAFAAFVAYRDLGPDRSIAKAAEQLGRNADHFRRWSARNRWRARVEAYDAHEDRLLQQRLRAHRQRAARKTLDMVDKAREKVAGALEALEPEKLAPADAMRVWTVLGQAEERVLEPAGARVAGSQLLDLAGMPDEERRALMSQMYDELGARLASSEQGSE